MNLGMIKKYQRLTQILFLLSLTACTNSVLKSLSSSVGSTGVTGVTGTTGTTGTSTTGASLVISNVTLGSSTDGSQIPSFNVFFDTTKSTASVSNYCNVSTTASSNQTARPCVCQFSWSESNPNSSSNVATPRVVQKPVTNVQVALISCTGPDVYNSEIINGTQIKITILPDSSNPTSGQFQVNNYLYTKSDTVVTGSFQDSQGHIFDNIMHYSCYQTFSKPMSILSKTMTVNNPTTGVVSPPILYASQFCLNASSEGCSTAPASNFSAQSYYYSMYLRKTERGAFNQANANFICPRVVESLHSNNTTGTKDDPWPSDETFALSLGPTEDFTVGVDAHTKLAGNQDPTTVNTTCGSIQAQANTDGTGGGTNGSAPPEGGLVTSCLGFAAPVNADGTCPFIKDSSNLQRPTLRLRKYIAIYPRNFNADGSLTSGQTQGVDTVYILDRPVRAPSTANPLKPYTMLGPKPCPFAYYDRKQVTGSRGYLASSNAAWAGKNVDGIEFPNVDGTDSDGKASCSAVLPVLASDNSYLTFTTVNKNMNSPAVTPSGIPHAYIRPTQPFLPHYEEDTSFRACAPQADPIKEAPLHFSRDPSSGNVAWCTESYPTQNPYIKSVDPVVSPTATPTEPSGTIPPYTSHIVKNSASNACNASAISGFAATSKYAYPNPTLSGGYAHHSSFTRWYEGNASNTCDRTVTTTDLDWTRFPLLSPPTDIEIAINTDSSYNCTVTYDGGSGKAGKYTPTDGCCDKNTVYVCSGFGANCTNATKQTAHLEPDVPCKTPNY